MVKTDLYFDAENQVICIRSIDENGAVIEDLPQIRLKLEDLQYAAQADVNFAIEMMCRRVHFTDANDGLKRRCYGAFTMPEDDETDDGHSSETQDVYLGGGSGLTLRQLVSFESDNTLICEPVGGGDDFPVALQPELRTTITTQTIDGETWAYSGYGSQRRLATFEDIVERQVITPRFLVGDVIPVWSCSDTGIGTVKLIAITGREWAKEPDRYDL